jgi:hypothetical protein
MRRLLMAAALSEGATGLLLLVSPAIVVRLLFGETIAGAGVAMSRIAGVSLIALGLACWPGRATDRAFCGMLTYSGAVTLYLVITGIGGEAGILLWPAVLVHAGFSALLLGAWWKRGKTSEVSA